MSSAGENYRGFGFEIFQPKIGSWLVRGRRVDGRFFTIPSGEPHHLVDHFDTMEFSVLDEAVADAKVIVDTIANI